MYPKLFHIYGPLSINSYGAMIAIGIMLFTWLCKKDKRMQRLLSYETIANAIVIGIICGVFGGRLLHYLSPSTNALSILDICSLWEGGFSILGCILAIVAGVPMYLYYANVPILPVLDRASLYAPLLQSIARIGCFLAGCCYGTASMLPWAVCYTHQDSLAPLHMHLHPVQLYSTISLALIFVILFFLGQRLCKIPGQLICLYLMLVGMERFLMDYFRADAKFIYYGLSFNQWLALSIILVSGTIFTVQARSKLTNFSL